MSIETVRLECTKGSSNKFYNICLEKRPEGFVVWGESGPIGGSAKIQPKGSYDTADQARSAVSALVQAKSRKSGYIRVDGGSLVHFSAPTATAPTHSAAVDVDLDIEPLLPAPTSLCADDLIADPAIHMQTKHDGERLILVIAPGATWAINKRGQKRSVPRTLDAFAASANNAPDGGLQLLTIIDGEQVGDTYFAFDLLWLNGLDLRDQSFRRRYAALTGIVPAGSTTIQISHASTFPASKRREYDRLRAEGAEGVVFKRASAPYIGGRSSSDGIAMKDKFVESATVRVRAHNGTKRSVRIELLDGPVWTECGNVTIPTNHRMPEVGALVEVQYLYVTHRQGALYQPVYKGLRTDVAPEECTVAQLKVRDESRPTALAA